MALIPDFATLLNDSTGIQSPAMQTYGSGTRQAMIFSSRLRSRQAPTARDVFSDDVSGRLNVEAVRFWRWMQRLPPEGERRIIMAINPNSVHFSQGKRITEKKTRDGSIFFHFTNNQGQNNDILRLEFGGNTGNIDRRGSLGAPERSPWSLKSGTAVDKELRGEQDTGALRKILTWHNLYMLTREPMLLPDNRPNEFWIDYISALFPFTIRFYGFFSEVLDFAEVAEKPNSRDYSFEFVVTRTSPDLDDAYQMVSTVIQDIELRSSPDAVLSVPGGTP